MKLTRVLKHVFIPHEHNDYKPHFFRELSIVIILAACLFLLGVSVGTSFVIHRTVLGANVTANVLVDLTNESRIAFNQAPLARNGTLDSAAQLKAEDMVRGGYFSHNSPTGITPWYWFQQAGYLFLYAGENLAINFTDATAVRNAWLASPTHRANLLDVRFKEIGMATLQGIYKDSPTIYVVQMFGTPATPKVAAAAPVQHEQETALEPKDESEIVPAKSEEPQIRGEKVTQETKPAYQPVLETKELAIVKNTEEVEEKPVITLETPVYSTWYERLLFGGTAYIQAVYRALFAFVLIALIVMVAIEVRRQHWKHIAYGLAILLIIALCTIINQALF